MIRGSFALAILLLAQSAWAGSSHDHIFMCKILGFDKKEVKGQCDPTRPKSSMKIPRDWIGEEDSLKMNKHVKFTIDDQQLEQWLAMNKIEGTKGKRK